MNPPNALRVLIWKDARIVLPLVGIAALTSLFAHLFLLLTWRYFDMERSTLDSWPIALWTLMPGLVAFGAAASLVGTEEDSGTLTWLRSLPIRWQTIAHAKFLVALIAFALEWSFATALLWMIGYGAAQPGAVPLFVSWDNLLIITFLQVFLLVLGFVMAYALRSPLIGLLLLLPLLFATTVPLTWLLFILELLEAPGLCNGRSLIGILFLSGFVLLHYLAARRRLNGPIPTRGETARQTLVSSTYYQPPEFLAGGKPSVVAALLWQQFRQTLPLATTLIAGSGVLMLLFLTEDAIMSGRSASNFTVFVSLAPSFVTLSACWMGALVFYPDNQQNRSQFFSDRGISPTHIWWTRLLPPLLGCLLLAIFIAMIPLFPGAWRSGWSNTWQWLSVLFVFFAFGQLISQGIRRPVLAFLAAPAFGSLSLIPVFYLGHIMGDRFPPLLVMFPVLLIASWRLAPSWLEKRGDLRYALGVLGYTALAIVLPCLISFSAALLRLAGNDL